MNERRLHYQEAPRNERLIVCEYYHEVLLSTEGVDISPEELDERFFGCWWDVIRYTFGPTA